MYSKIKKKTILTIPTEMHSSDVFKVHLKTIKHEKKQPENHLPERQTSGTKQHLAQTHFNDMSQL